MSYKNSLLLHETKHLNLNKESKYKKLKLYNTKLDIKKKFSEKLKFKLNCKNHSRNKSIKFKKGRNKKYLKLSFNSRTSLNNYTNKNKSIISNNTYYNSSKLKISQSCQDYKNKSCLDNYANKRKYNLVNRKSSYKTIDLNNNYNISIIKNSSSFYKKKVNNSNIIKNNYKTLKKTDFSKYNMLNLNIIKENKDNNSKNSSEMNIFKEYIYNNYINNQKMNLKDNLFNMKYNNFFFKSNSMDNKLKNKKSDWKNEILDCIISNLTNNKKKKVSKINFYDDNNNHQKIKMFTILDLYNKKHI